MNPIFVPYRRVTLLMPSGPTSHLFVVMTDPVEQENAVKQVALVNITSVKPGLPSDLTCLLSSGDHPFIHHESYVLYSGARIVECNALIRGVSNGIFTRRDPFDEAVFDRIANGMLHSPHIPLKVKQFFQATLGS